jgi:hypothetical protein
MALPTSYMTSGYTKIPKYFDTLLTARAPEKFTNKFMADLGFTSSTDRLFANVLKAIGFLDDSGVPTERYYKFLDQSCSKQMVAEGIKEAYVDLFNLNVSANTMTQVEVEGKFKTLTNGSKAAATITQMAKTFVALCGYADWSEPEVEVQSAVATPTVVVGKSDVAAPVAESTPQSQQRSGGFDLNYNIHIHLPATRDQSVYDALFASLAKHIPLK